MNNSGTQFYRQLIESILHYSKGSLDILQYGEGDLPQWANDTLSTIKVHLKDVTHFLRGGANRGVRYALNDHNRPYIAIKNLREISKYAGEALLYITVGEARIPSWAKNKISICAEYMDLFGHWLENENAEGRSYGASSPVGLIYQTGYGSALAPGPPSTAPPAGRRFGVPGFAPGQPGWAGQAGVAQIPNLARGACFRRRR